MKQWQQLKADIESATAAIEMEEPGELRNIRLGDVGNEAGSFGQFWTALDFSNGMIRDFSMYTMYPILKLAYDDAYDLEQLEKAYMAFHPPYTEYLGYTGMREMQGFCRRFRDCFGEFESKAEFIALYRSFLLYTNKLSAWSYHYFPWEIGFSWKRH